MIICMFFSNQMGLWTEANGLSLIGDLKSLIREKQKKTYRVVVIPDVSSK